MRIADYQLPIVPAFLFVTIALAQESPNPTSSPTGTQTPSASPRISRTARISFVPPPMEGAITLGIFDANKKLVRVLQREAMLNEFTIDETSLTTTWDGKDDGGADLPAGRYHARGYMVGDLKTEEVSPAGNEPPSAQSSDHISVKLVLNPLLSDVRVVIELGIGFDGTGSFLRTMDNLPLFTISKTSGLSRASIQKEGDKSAVIWQSDGTSTKEFRISNLDKIMAFDCGDFELK